jgi:uncharacterized protein (DUF111 family)
MATKPKSTGNGGTGDRTVDVSIPADFAITAHGHTLSAGDLEGMSPKALGYLLANGYKQSLTDAAAFTKETKAGKSAAEVEALANDRRAKRHEAILTGDVGAVVGSRATPIEKFMRDVAIERIKSIATAKGVKMPKSDVLKAAVEKITAKQGPDIRAEAEARMSAAKAASADMADLLG